MRLRAFLRERRGAASIVTALSSVALIGFVGLATDVGSVYLETRRLQGAADLAALAAIQQPQRARQLASATVRANNWDGARVEVTPGAYVADRARTPGLRFTPNAPNGNAVRVDVRTSAPLYFSRLFIPEGRMQISRSATAAQTQLASFQIGSGLLSLEGGIANDLLTALTGSEVSLSVMDYQSLLRANVDLFQYVDALRTRLDLEGASYDSTLEHEVAAPEALGALGDVLALQDPRAARAMHRIAESADDLGDIGPLDTLIDLGPYGPQDQALDGQSQVRVSAMDLTSAILQIANGERQVRLELGASLPGLTSTNVWLAIGERPNNSPWISITDDYDVVLRTAQMRLFIQAATRPGGVLGVANVNVPLLVELASAEARLESINCGFNGRTREVTLAVSPSIGSLSIGDIDTGRLDDFRTPLNPVRADLVRTPLLRVQGLGQIRLGGREWHRVRFSGDEIDRGVVKTVSTRDAARTTVATLLSETDISVRALGLGVSTGPVTGAVSGALSSVAAPLDALVNSLTDLLGIRLGEADVRVNGVRCGGAALVA